MTTEGAASAVALTPAIIGEELRLNDFVTVVLTYLHLSQQVTVRSVCRRWWLYVHELLLDSRSEPVGLLHPLLQSRLFAPQIDVAAPKALISLGTALLALVEQSAAAEQYVVGLAPIKEVKGRWKLTPALPTMIPSVMRWLQPTPQAERAFLKGFKYFLSLQCRATAWVRDESCESRPRPRAGFVEWSQGAVARSVVSLSQLTARIFRSAEFSDRLQLFVYRRNFFIALKESSFVIYLVRTTDS